MCVSTTSSPAVIIGCSNTCYKLKFNIMIVDRELMLSCDIYLEA